MEQWWNGIDGVKPECLEKKFSQCHFCLYKSHMDYPGIESESNYEEAGGENFGPCQAPSAD
jgi:hypothetical protein